MFHTLVIDLDNTIYPASSGLMEAIGNRIGLYMRTVMGFNKAEIHRIRQLCRKEYGTTLQGLHDLYGIDCEEYLSFVHDLDLKDYLQPNAELLHVLQAYPQKKVIFSNADHNHITRVLQFMNLGHLFEIIVDSHKMAPYVKPQTESFKLCLDHIGLSNWDGCAFIDDYPPNIEAASSLGIFSIQVCENLVAGSNNQIRSLGDLPGLIPLD